MVTAITLYIQAKMFYKLGIHEEFKPLDYVKFRICFYVAVGTDLALIFLIAKAIK